MSRLTPAQQQALELAIDLAEHGGAGALIGPAGSGKTFTVREAMRKIARRGIDMVLLAPTHKAKAHMTACCGAGESGVPWAHTKPDTVQRALGMTPRTVYDDEKFELPLQPSKILAAKIEGKTAKAWKTGNRIICPRIIIVDESSMVPWEQAEAIESGCRDAGVGVLFVGDPYQLPPIDQKQLEGEDLSADDSISDLIAISELQWAEVGANMYFANKVERRVTLTQVMRHGGPILDQANIYRRARDSGAAVRRPDRSVESDQGSVIVDSWGAVERLKEDLGEVRLMIAAGKPSKDVYQAIPRVISYTNRQCEINTKMTRVAVWGQRAALGWLKDEIISIPKYCMSIEKTDAPGRYVPIYSNTDAIILGVSMFEISALSCPDFIPAPDPAAVAMMRDDYGIDFNLCGRFQLLKCLELGPCGDPKKRVFEVVTPLFKEQADTRRNLAALAKKIKSRKRNKEQVFHSKHKMWDQFKPLKMRTTLVRSVIAMTAHSSQGSTFQNVYVDNDVFTCGCKEIRVPLAYVAHTRASKTVTYGSLF